MALEAHVLRLEGPKLYTCVVAAGLIYGAGEDSLFKTMSDAYNFVTPLVLPSAAKNMVPTIYIGILCGFLCWLIDLQDQRFTKQYMLAYEPEPATLADIAGAIIDEWTNRATAGAFASSHTGAQYEALAGATTTGEAEDLGGITTTPLVCGGNDVKYFLENKSGSNSVKIVSLRTDLRPFNGPFEGFEISFGYPESIMLALDCAGLEVTGSVFEKAKIRTFMSKNGTEHGLVGNIPEVVDEFMMVRGLTPRHIWVLRQPGDLPQLRAAAEFISQRLQLPCINVDSSIKWLFTQPQQALTSAISNSGNSAANDQQPVEIDDAVAPDTTPGSITTVEEPRATSQHQKEVWALQSELGCNIHAKSTPPSANTLSPKLVARCVRLRLLDPFTAIHGYVLDACPASPVMLKDIFEDATSLRAGQEVKSPIRVAPALTPSQIVVLSASVDPTPQASAELKQWTATEALDWRFGGDASRPDDTKTMIPALEELFCGSIQPLVIPLSHFFSATDICTVDLNLGIQTPPHENFRSYDNGRNEKVKPWWYATDTKAYNPGINIESTLPLPPNPHWKHALSKLLENKSVHGHLDKPQTEFAPMVEPETLTTQMSGAVPLPSVTGEIMQDNLAGVDSCKSTYIAPAHRNQFDDISQNDYEELHHRSTVQRHFLMKNVMTHLTKAMLEVIGLPKAENKITTLADMLASEARRDEERADAYAYLRYRSSLAKLNELRQEEAEGDSCECAREATSATLERTV